MRKRNFNYIDEDMKAELFNKILINILLCLLCLCVISFVVLLWIMCLTKRI